MISFFLSLIKRLVKNFCGGNNQSKVIFVLKCNNVEKQKYFVSGKLALLNVAPS